MPKSERIGRHGRVMTGDVVACLDQLPARDTYEIVLADPPYNIGKDFGNSHDLMPLTEYVRWSWRWMKRCLNHLDAEGIMYVYGFPEILAHIAVEHPRESQRWLQWHYTNKTVPTNDFWQRSHESILAIWHSGNGRPRLRTDDIREPYNEAYRKAAGRTRNPTPGRYAKQGRPTEYKVHAKGALPRDVLKVPALAGGAGRKERWFICRDHGNRIYPPTELSKHRGCEIMKHPTQKPATLTERLLRSKLTDGQGRVLIPFMGSGSEAVVAQRMNVGFTAIDMNPEFVAFAKKWLKAERG